jgi:hypothetical protein
MPPSLDAPWRIQGVKVLTCSEAAFQCSAGLNTRTATAHGLQATQMMVSSQKFSFEWFTQRVKLLLWHLMHSSDA